MKIELRCVELFGGIGAPRKALERIGIPFKILDYVEIDPYAVNSYNAMYNEEFKPKDIVAYRRFHKDVDIIFHGSPCQDFTIAGNQQGGIKGTSTRSSLLWETVRIAKKLLPKCIVWENVKNVLSIKHKDVFNSYIDALEKVGYITVYWILNAKDYGDCQNRERLFAVSILKSYKLPKIPIQVPNIRCLADIMEDTVEAKLYLQKELTDWFFKNHSKQHFTKTNKLLTIGSLQAYGSPFKHRYASAIYHKNGIAPTIMTRADNPTIKVLRKGKIRGLSQLECWRCMGFDDSDFENANKVTALKTQLYKQAGNSISVRTLEALITAILEVIT